MANQKPIKLSSGKLKQFISTDTIPTNNLGTGTANDKTYLAGDQTYKQINIDLTLSFLLMGG